MQDGFALSTDHNHDKRWKVSWLYDWLVKNGPGFRFTQLPSEMWHWDHAGGAPDAPSDAEAGTQAGSAPPGGMGEASQPSRPATPAAPQLGARLHPEHRRRSRLPEVFGRSPGEIKAAMRDKIVEIGPSKVSRHCGDPATLNVIDVAPSSIGGGEAQTALVAAARQEEGRRVSRFIPYPDDPGHHFEIRP